LQQNGWNWRTSSEAKLASIRRPIIACSLSYADYGSKTNAVVLLGIGHTLRGEQAWERREREGKLKLECG
jgi:hypothetical protein